MIQKTAGEIAGDPELYNRLIKLSSGKVRWECMGYSQTGTKVKFGIIIEKPGYKFYSRVIYVDPNKIVFID